MYKHVSLRERVVNGKTVRLLLGPDGHPLDAFTAFSVSLRNFPFNTCKAYSKHVAEFIDYLIEAKIFVAPSRAFTKFELVETLESYGEYLLLGIESRWPIAREVARTRPSILNSFTSIVPKKAAVRRFLQVSEQVRQEMAELVSIYGGNASVSCVPLFPDIGNKRRLTQHEITALSANSMLAGVIAGGPKLVHCIVLESESEVESYDEHRAFPYDKVMDLINAMPTYRDKAYHAFLAASGCRTHEALQLLLNTDVDVVRGTVRLVDPSTRPGHQSYRALTPGQRELLAWKGRTTNSTLLIEPFASAFWESLQKYLEREHLPHGHNDFLFQFLKGPDRGQPYFLSASSTRLELFHRITKKIGVVLPNYSGPHSLRHTYCTYLLNYFPCSNGSYGLPLHIVRQVVGHEAMKSTLKYAKIDNDIWMLEIQHANNVLFQNGASKTLLELKLAALNAQMTKVKNLMSSNSDA